MTCRVCHNVGSINASGCPECSRVMGDAARDYLRPVAEPLVVHEDHPVKCDCTDCRRLREARW
jgi:hypothetical protein